ncbi:DUF2975 domain-containing protein [Rossellomorea aquimaris]|uniref:DUF2975 domain-containing protein n=1 Tax=Rossellomorea aquimaris TaxID=189382 RepID=UPI001CD27B15|nr:DUF2975 domain-containing protein [Rossellomorea aquimaris]MCA1053706.1 DUF2975 domain-containing protein [Rossellomorea aquimaris]
MMKKTALFFLKSAIFMIGLFVVGISIFGLPKLATYSAVVNPEFAFLKWPILLGLYSTEIPFFLGLYKAYKLVVSIDTRKAFTIESVNNLRMIKCCAWIISVVYIIGALYLFLQGALHPGIALIGMVIVFASVTISVFAAVLHKLLSHALELKIENELTV